MVREVLAERDGWVRINAVRTPAGEADLDAVAGLAAGIRIPKVESGEDAQWAADRAPGTPLVCAIESARGVLAAAEIATVHGVHHLSMGGFDLRRDLDAGDGNLQTLYVRSHLVVVSRAAGLEPPINRVHPRLDDEAGLREQSTSARSLGFFGKSVIHPRQLPVVHEAFTPTEHELAWARASERVQPLIGEAQGILGRGLVLGRADQAAGVPGLTVDYDRHFAQLGDQLALAPISERRLHDVIAERYPSDVALGGRALRARARARQCP
jgi:hypothetical protein